MKALWMGSFVLFLGVHDAASQLLLNSGDTYGYEFTSLPLISRGTGGGPVVRLALEFSDGPVPGGATLQYELFNSMNPPVLFSSGDVTTLSGSASIEFYGFYWQDLVGSFRLTTMSGSTYLDSFSIIANRQGFTPPSFFDTYGETVTPVPEHGLSVLICAFLGSWIILGKRAKPPRSPGVH